jgi:hypothetical protein
MQMHRDIEHLRVRANGGDPAAFRDFERRFSGSMRRIVRRVLKLNRAETSLERGIMSEANRQRSTVRPSDGEQLVSAVTRRLCEAVFARPALRDELHLATTRPAWTVDTEAV